MKEFVKHNFMPVGLAVIGLFGFSYMVWAATITTINATDLVSDSRAVINTNFSNLNTDKLEGVAINFVDVTYNLINGTTYYNASSTATSNLSWRFNNGFVSNASSTLVSGFTASASSTVSGLFQASNLFVNGSSTILTLNVNTGNLGSTTAQTLNANSLAVSGLISAITLTNANGVFSAYAGTSCTNQFPRSLSALGAATCATVVAGDVDLADLTATNGTLTFSGTYDGQVARTIGLNLGSSNEWTASTTISAILNVEALSLTASGTISILNTNTANIGSSTAQQLNVNSCNGCEREIKPIYQFRVASTTFGFDSGGYIDLPAREFAYTITDINCYVRGGTSKVINVSHGGTPDTETITCATTKTDDDGSIANGAVTAGELMRIEMGATSGVVDAVLITISGILAK